MASSRTQSKQGSGGAGLPNGHKLLPSQRQRAHIGGGRVLNGGKIKGGYHPPEPPDKPGKPPDKPGNDTQVAHIGTGRVMPRGGKPPGGKPPGKKPGYKPSAKPFLTPTQQAALATYEAKVSAKQQGLGRQMGDATYNTNQALTLAGKQHTIATAGANESMAARGLFQSSIRDGDLNDIDATMTMRQNILNTNLQRILTDAQSQLATIQAENAITINYYHQLAVQNAQAQTPVLPGPDNTQVAHIGTGRVMPRGKNGGGNGPGGGPGGNDVQRRHTGTGRVMPGGNGPLVPGGYHPPEPPDKPGSTPGLTGGLPQPGQVADAMMQPQAAALQQHLSGLVPPGALGKFRGGRQRQTAMTNYQGPGSVRSMMP